jgi:hypothetical protein
MAEIPACVGAHTVGSHPLPRPNFAGLEGEQFFFIFLFVINVEIHILVVMVR